MGAVWGRWCVGALGSVGGEVSEREPLLTWEQQRCHGRLASLGPLQLGSVSLAALLDDAVALDGPAMVSTAAASLADLPVLQELPSLQRALAGVSWNGRFWLSAASPARVLIFYHSGEAGTNWISIPVTVWDCVGTPCVHLHLRDGRRQTRKIEENGDCGTADRCVDDGRWLTIIGKKVAECDFS